MEYKLFCDSTCDLTMELAEKLNIEIIPMQFTLDEKNYNHYLDGRELSFSDFYKALKNGADAKTAQVQFETFNKYFEPVLKEGKDIIYICFTSGMSGTYNTCNIAVEELREKYPDRKITVIDSLCASAGEGYLAYLAGLKMQENPTYDELCTYIEDTKMRIIHWFVVDDLDQLKKDLANAEGLVLMDDIANCVYPMPCNCDDKDEVFVGRVRRDFSVKSGINMWVVADNIRKGAATNAVQIAQYLIANWNK